MKRSTLRFIAITMLVGSLSLMSGCTSPKATENSTKSDSNAATSQIYKRAEVITSADEAKQLLVDGNARFVSGNVLNDDLSNAKREDLFNKGQKPFVTIVSCSDSRVPPEILFDQALGDLFIVRSAGNVVDKIATGSVEYGAEHTKTPLILVLGHDKCGAVTATVNGGEAPGSIGAIVEKIKPSVDKAKAAGTAADKLIEESAELNVEATIAELEKSPIIKELVETGKVKIIGAKYHIGTGQVEWYEPAKTEAHNAEAPNAEAPKAEATTEAPKAEH